MDFKTVIGSIDSVAFAQQPQAQTDLHYGTGFGVIVGTGLAEGVGEGLGVGQPAGSIPCFANKAASEPGFMKHLLGVGLATGTLPPPGPPVVTDWAWMAGEAEAPLGADHVPVPVRSIAGKMRLPPESRSVADSAVLVG